jgi:hypothetical protein
MLKLNFDCRDLFKAPRAALSLQRLWIQLTGMSVGYLAYLVLSYASLLAAGYELKSAWSQFGLLPCLFSIGDTFPWFSWLIAGVGSLFFFFAYLVTNTAVARAIYMTSKGNSFYTWKEAVAFSFRKLWSILLTPISMIVLIGLMLVGAWIVGLLGKIPAVGEIGVSLFSIVWLMSSLLILFFAIVAAVATLLLPAVLATTDEDAFEAIFQSFSIVWGQPIRFIFYEALNVVIAVVAMGIFAIFLKEALALMNMLFTSFMGGDYANLANNGQALLQSWTLQAQSIVSNIYHECAHYIYFSRDFIMIPPAGLSSTVRIASFIFALNLLILAGTVVSYGVSTFTAGNTLAFMVFKFNKDEENLLERQDAEEETEEDDQLETSDAPAADNNAGGQEGDE